MFPLQKNRSDRSLDILKYDVYVCDIEAHKWIDFRTIGSYGKKKNKGAGEFRHFESLRDYFMYMVEDGRAKKIYAHFGGIYDFMFLMDHLVLKESDERFTIRSLIPRGSGILCFDVEYFEPYLTKDGEKASHTCKLSFTDSSALLGHSLKNLTHSFGVEHKKTEFNFETWNGEVTEELLDYLKHDCVGLYEVLERFYGWPLIKRAGRSTTIASQALKVFQTMIKEDIEPLRGTDDAYTRKAYFGGRTEIFKPYFERKKESLKCYDVNSLYPSTMKKYDYPSKPKDFVYDYESSGLGIYHVQVKVPDSLYIPPLGSIVRVPSIVKSLNSKGELKEVLRSSDKYVFPVGEFDGHFTNVELEAARELGVKIKKVYSGLTFESGGKIFSEYLTTLYEMRLEAQKRGDVVGTIICKILLNSLYGRFGMNLTRENLSFDYSDDAEIFREFKSGKYIIPLYKKMATIRGFTMSALSCFVTSYSRVDMMRDHYSRCGDDIWYTDTDSLYTTKNLKSGKELGELKLEYEMDNAVFLLPKTYISKGKNPKTGETVKNIAMKGFSNKLVQGLTVEDFQNALSGDFSALKVMHPEKVARFRTAMKKEKFLSMMDPSPRQIRSFYDKREVFKSSRHLFDTRPLKVRDGQVVNFTEDTKSYREFQHHQEEASL